MKTSLNQTPNIVPVAAMERTRRAKIVATLGPSSSTPEVFRKLVRAGLDVARLNFSHGTHAQKADLIRMVRTIAKEEHKPICILADLQGPKIRTGKLKGGKPVQLVAGKRPPIPPREIQGDSALVGTTFKTLAENLEPGARILLSDGLIELRVHSVKGGEVTCEIVNGGMLGENKSINLPGIPVKVPSLTEKDEEDLVFAVSQGVDVVAVSFVRTAADIRHVKSRLAALKSDAWVVAKLEKPQAIEHLDSMIDNPRPTRAEASDVANAIYDGTDSVMLSVESAAGKYPVEAVAMMHKIVTETEHQIRIDPPPALGHHPSIRLSIAETICECMSHAADDLDVAAIAIFTESGSTARLLSKYHPDPPIFALSPFENVINRSSMLWGTYPILCDRFRDTDKLVEMAEVILEDHGHVQQRQIVGIVAGTRTKSGATNFMRLHMVGDHDTELSKSRKPAKKKK